jgi:hypothetical protein
LKKTLLESDGESSIIFDINSGSSFDIYIQVWNRYDRDFDFLKNINNNINITKNTEKIIK